MTSHSREVFIVGYARTAIGSLMGSLSTVPATRLGAAAIEGALKRAGVSKDQVSEVILGNVLTSGEGQAPARQAMIYAGIPNSVPAMTLNKVCGSGMKAVMLGAQSIVTGDSDIVVAGGMENMSLSPHLIMGARSGFRMGNQQMLDSMIQDGLWDPYNNQHMGNCAELCAREKSFSRKEQDSYAIESFKRALDAQKKGLFKDEIVAVAVPGKKGEVSHFETDEGPSKVNFDKIPELKPVFDKTGTVTAANASTINDGAAVLVLASAEKVKSLGLKPIAKIVSYAGNAQEPQWFTTAPAEAMKRALGKATWDLGSVDLVEVNEAFAVVALAAMKDLNIPHAKINVRGGAISLGHPIGASGARILVTLVSSLKEQGKKRGLAGICIGGGEATAVAIEML